VATVSHGLENGSAGVTFQFPRELWAETVHLVGNLYDWDRSSLTLIRDRQGNSDWMISLELAGVLVQREMEFRRIALS